MMYEDDIKKVDEWFSKHTEYYGTNHEGDEFPDLCLIRCCFGTGDVCIWFYRKDLEEAVFY